MPLDQNQNTTTVHCRIDAQLDGFPISLEIDTSNAQNLVTRLKEIGAVPPVAPVAPGQTPLCPVHGKAMKPSKRPGKFYCAQRDGEGSFSFCKETA